MDQASDQQSTTSLSTTVTSSTITRTALRPPGTLRKQPPPPSSVPAHNARLNSYMAQNRFKLLNPASNSTANTNSGSILRPLQRLQLRADYLLPSQHTEGISSSGTTQSLNNNPERVSPVSTATSSTTRMPPTGYSGLARPTPVQQIITSTNTKVPHKAPTRGVVKSSLTTVSSSNFKSSSQLRQPQSSSNQPGILRLPAQTLGGSQSKLAQPANSRPRTATTLVKPSGTSQTGTISCKASSEIRRNAPILAKSVGTVAAQRILDPCLRSQASTNKVVSSSTNQSTADHRKDIIAAAGPLIDLSSVGNDVGEIRKLLEQLLGVLQSAHIEQDNKDRENEKLRQEVRELKSKIWSIRSTVAANADSEPPTPNIPQNSMHNHYHESSEEDSPRQN